LFNWRVICDPEPAEPTTGKASLCQLWSQRQIKNQLLSGKYLALKMPVLQQMGCGTLLDEIATSTDETLHAQTGQFRQKHPGNDSASIFR
jgi:hypothetical protein